MTNEQSRSFIRTVMAIASVTEHMTGTLELTKPEMKAVLRASLFLIEEHDRTPEMLGKTLSPHLTAFIDQELGIVR